MLLVQHVPSISHTFYSDIHSKSYAMNRVSDFLPLIISFSTQLDQSISVYLTHILAEGAQRGGEGTF